MTIVDYCYAVVPLALPFYMITRMVWMATTTTTTEYDDNHNYQAQQQLQPLQQLVAYVVLAVAAFGMTNALVPHIQHYTLRKGICGKDLGKRGTDRAEVPIPEALGIAPGTIFLVCLIFCLVGYDVTTTTTTQLQLQQQEDPSSSSSSSSIVSDQHHHHNQKLLDVNSALLSICFMLFLGFTDDVLDWPWRYKLVLPTVASLPLLCCYTGSTSIVIPIPMRWMLVQQYELTMLGQLLSPLLVSIDVASNGTVVDLGVLYLVYMGLLAVFCTNAINIYAGINGLEAGQSYIIGCAILVHNLIEIQAGSLAQENHLFSSMIVLIFVGATLGLLRHNWYPADVFVGDTFCYFAGMTFAVVGILGHFSKTLLLFFIPQVLNFVWSIPQLFKIVPCPRHRLPAFDAKTGRMQPSTFDCTSTEHIWLKRVYRLPLDATKIPNLTVINLALYVLGPMPERKLCVVLLAFQMLCCGFGFFVRYYIAQFFFEAG